LPSRYKTASSLFMNEFAVTTPKPKDVPRPLAKRSAIDPFIVMDVMGEANARELEGHDIIHMEVGQPATPAPRAAGDARSKRSRASGSATPRLSVCQSSESALPATCQNATAWASRQSAWW